MVSPSSDTVTQCEVVPLGQLQMEAGVGREGMFAEDPQPGHTGGKIQPSGSYFICFKSAMAKGHLRATLRVVRGQKQRAACFLVKADDTTKRHSRALPATQP